MSSGNSSADCTQYRQEEIATIVGDQKEETPSAASGNGEDSMQVDSSELSDDASEVTSESASAAGKKSSRQKDLRLKAHTIAHSKEREAARAKQASQKQAQTEQRRLEEEVAKVDRRLEGIERDFRKLLGGVRVKPIGRDRFYNRIWWFDGMGSASLIGSGGIALYGTGRIFIQGPSEFDLQQLEKKAIEDAEDIDARRREEEGPECMLGPQDWAMYTELEEVCLFVVLRFLILIRTFVIVGSIRLVAQPQGPSRIVAEEYPDQVVASYHGGDAETYCGKSSQLLASLHLSERIKIGHQQQCQNS